MISVPFGAFSETKSHPRGVPEIHRISISEYIDSMSSLPFGLQSLFGAKSDPRGVPEMYTILISETNRFHDFPTVWVPEQFRSQKPDPTGVPVLPDMHRI